MFTPSVGGLVAIDVNVGLGLVELEVAVGIEEHAALDGLLHEGVRHLGDAGGIVRGNHDKLHVGAAGAGKRRPQEGQHAHAGHAAQFLGDFRQQLHGGALALVPGRQRHERDAVVAGGIAVDLDRPRRLGKAPEDPGDLVGVAGQLVDVRVGRGRADAR